LKRKHREGDDLEKMNKKKKINSNSNSGVLLTTPTSVPNTPPSSSNSSNATRSYDQSINRYDTNYNHHRNRNTPYSRSDTRNDNRRLIDFHLLIVTFFYVFLRDLIYYTVKVFI